MAPKLKKLSDQVIVITGASSGIGLATAEAAAKKGAKLVLAARSDQALADIAPRLGKDVVAVPCDVSDRAQVERVAETAIAKFGRIDTWVNNAGVGMYGRLDETSDADARRLFDINYWASSSAAWPPSRT
jgi:NAD(P)-dependent dehydrogenase (short-subunit alcohol dehydrogenase family)